MQDQQAHHQESPNTDAVNDPDMGASTHVNDRQHRHTMDWPEIMHGEGYDLFGNRQP